MRSGYEHQSVPMWLTTFCCYLAFKRATVHHSGEVLTHDVADTSYRCHFIQMSSFEVREEKARTQLRERKRLEQYVILFDC